ncbi:alpha/beta hydrolase [Novosphingobium piscinae]|uniref:Alpha/beta hydrolase n=1 Tax=Novosphingobium piscinae TaxID=1507448 RepID=A0A7X1FVA7_9SPHN|nr:alpha/beta hydrolase [Novosphingobium piscinae]MBC2667638.1 alpha/beta hydrolase [Novosphingobium piscinae]
MSLGRRDLLGGGLLGGGLLGGALLGFPAAAAAPAPPAAPPFTTLPLWPGGPPGGIPAGLAEREIPRSPSGPADDTAFLHVTAPTLTWCQPARPNGAAILLVPGGSYARVAIGHGGAALLRAFAGLGYASFLLKYRLPGDPWAAGPDAPLQDAQRALRLIRSLAPRAGFDPRRMAVWGGSAGGHLAARLVNSAQPAYAPADVIDRIPLGVAAALLLYPVNLMTGPFAHAPSRSELLRGRAGVEPASLTAEAGVHAASPPTLVAHALDDTVVPVENGLSYFAALRRHGIPAELHVQERGGHGFGWADETGSPLAWTALAAAFLTRHLA